MTEEEARGRWCHASLGMETKPRHCKASACMAWRWVQVMANKEAYNRTCSTFTMGGPQVEAIYEDTDQGYCGLAGKP